MWEFLGYIVDQLGQTFKWFLTGLFLTITLLILLYKNKLLGNNSSLSFIKKISYYLFFPLYIGIISWFLSATLIVEKHATELARVTLEKAEESIFPQFSSYVLSLTDNWLDMKVNTKEELVNSYLQKNEYEQGAISTQAMKWTLINGIEYIENKAIENGDINLGDETVNFPKLISNYLSGTEGIAALPFSYLRGKSVKMIHSYTMSFYWIYFWMAFVVVFILSLDIYFTIKGRKNKVDSNFVNPSTTLENKQKKLENSIKEIHGNLKIEQ